MQRIDFLGISCYSSIDLVTWTFEGVALSPDGTPCSDRHPSRVVERPKVSFAVKHGRLAYSMKDMAERSRCLFPWFPWLW